ncbi:hypothetical protein BCR32DRAFT_295925 [Anaeromyces robustus]|uniref:Uncharacterized protein n=1 Tax=Anaeromyces robustus TaxID=1754192 RepID=A0A1Y1WV26_9FUNG|nr:hypothetical protein BCR32DRAFT_295925 [Anaeromyces robustus]|eukprot:ORX76974.1 hypothetical protein BCR32DRAFT_295925 [Anaeromyces robustus]
MGYYLRLTMKYTLLATCLVQLVLIVYDVFNQHDLYALFNLIEVVFPIFEILALFKYKTKCEEEVNLTASVLKVFNAKTVMLMYIIYCVIGFIMYVFLSIIIFGLVNIENDAFNSYIKVEKKTTLTYVLYCMRLTFFVIGLITSIFVRHDYKKTLEVYQGFS